VKLWEPKKNHANKCFQTIIGHSGSILDMVYIDKVQLLVTSSTDKTMRIWRIDKARQLLMYPWFVEYQRAHSFESSIGRPLASGNNMK
jgi:WD40 repeat protein